MATAASLDTPTSADLEFMSFSAQGSSASPPPLPAAPPPGAAPGGAAIRSAVDDAFTIFSLLSPSFYVACFDVDVGDVVSRVRAALWPFRPPQPFLALVAGKPDLYGPVWLAATLVFTIAVGFNMASWLNFVAVSSVAPWEYDFKALTKAIVFVFGFTFGAPAAVWLGMGYALPRGVCLGLVTLTCVYGYSIVPFIPAALLCIVPSGALQWLAVAVAIVISVAFTLQSTYRSMLAAMEAAAAGQGTAAVAAQGGARALLLFIVALQVAFGVVLKVYCALTGGGGGSGAFAPYITPHSHAHTFSMPPPPPPSPSFYVHVLARGEQVTPGVRELNKKARCFSDLLARRTVSCCSPARPVHH